MLMDFFLIVVIFVWIADGYISGAITTGYAIFALFALVFTLGGTYRARDDKVLRHIFEILFVISVLLTFLIWQTGGDLSAIAALVLPLIAVLLAIFLFYLLIDHFFAHPYRHQGKIVEREGSRREHHLLDFFLLTALFTWLAELHADGAISADHVAVSLFGLAMLLGVSRKHLILRGFLEIAFAISVVLVFLILEQGGDLHAVGAMLQPLLAIVVVLFGLYVAIREVFRRPKDRK